MNLSFVDLERGKKMAIIQRSDWTRCKCRNVKNQSMMIWLFAGVLCFLAFSSSVSHAQGYLTASGTPTFVAPSAVEQGFTDNANGNLHLEWSFGSYTQRASNQPMAVRYVYDSNMIWNYGCGLSSCQWAPSNANGYGWRLATNGGFLNGLNCGSNGCSEWVFTDTVGTNRYFNVTLSTCPVANAYAADSSGYMLNLCQTGIYAPDGTLVYSAQYLQPASPGAEDSNGNYIIWGGSKDTLGRSLPYYASGCGQNQACYNVPNSQGGTSTYTVTTATIPVHTNFGQSGVNEFTGSMTVVTSIALPDGTSYGFTYDCDSTTGNPACGSPGGQSGYFGLVLSMTLPTGGTVSYGYTTFSDSYSNMTRWLNSRTSGGGVWSYNPQVISTCNATQFGSACQQKVTVTQPNGEYAVTTFTLNNGAWPVQVQSYDSSSNLLSTMNNTYDFSNACPFTNCVGDAFIRLLTAQTTVSIPSGNITKQTILQYDNINYGNITAKQEWGYYSGTSPSFPSTPDRATYMSYLYYTGTNNINRPLSVTLCNNAGTNSTCTGGGSIVQQTLNTYDSYSNGCPSGLVSVSGIQNHDDTNYGSSNTMRGNVTMVQRLVSGSTYLTAFQLCYDTTGQVTQQTDPKGNVTTYSYTDSFYSDNGTNSLTPYTPSVPTNAYATSITQPIIGTTAIGYYYGSGNQAYSTDPNGANSYSHFMDPFDRSTENDYALAGWDKTVYTSVTQSDSYVAVGDTTPSQNCQSCQHKQVMLDSLGRKVTETSVNNPVGAVSINTAYDANGRIYSVSHPSVGSGTVYEYYHYDGLDRTYQNIHPDNQYITALYGAAVVPGGVSSQQGSPTTYGYGYPVLYTDEAGTARQEWIDGFGRIIEVDEPNLQSPVATFYTYDAADNVTQVVQGVQTRTYVYDGLSRPTAIWTPEANSVFLSYTVTNTLCSGDSNSVCQETDARGVATTFSYDALNRLVGKVYSIPQGSKVAAMPNVCVPAGTSLPQQNVCFNYDQGGAAAFALGRLTQMVDTTGSESYTYDKAGRVTNLSKVVGTKTYPISYQYNAGDELTQITYPSGRVVQFSYNVVGQVCEAATQTSGCGTSASPFATGYTYNPNGKLTGFNYGNGVAATYNYSTNRSQLSSLSYTKGTQTLFSLNYWYQQDPMNCPNGNSVGNNGKIQCIADGVDSGRTTNYTYDVLGRLSTTVTNGSTGFPSWGLAETYDRYGNRWSQAVTAGSGPSNSISFGNPGGAQTNHPDGWCFDASGNYLGNQGTCPPTNPLYTFDGENRLTYIYSHVLGASTTFGYDGGGTRVTYFKSTRANTVYIFSGSQDIAEYDNGALPSSPSREYIYSDSVLGSGLLATITGGSSPTTTYFHPDNLSWRISTDGTSGSPTYGQVNGFQGNYPFGESWYTSNGTEFVFTSYQRGNGLDYALARYYDSTSGRFCSTDPLGGQLEDPQTWNRYTYVENDPINITDPSGKGFLSWLELALSILANFIFPGSGTPEFAGLGIDMTGASDLATFGAIVHAGMETNNFQQKQPQAPKGYTPCAPILFLIKAPAPWQAKNKGGAAGVKNVKAPGNVAYNPEDFGLNTAEAQALDKSKTPILFQPDWSKAEIPRQDGTGTVTPAPKRGLPQVPKGLPTSQNATLKGRDTLGGAGGADNPPNTIDEYGYKRGSDAQHATRRVPITVYIPIGSPANCPK